MAKIELINICKHFRDTAPAPASLAGLFQALRLSSRAPEPSPAAKPAFAIDNLNLHIPDGITLVILGPSGCGKSTLLRIIAGLIPPDSGMVRYAGMDMKDIPPGNRRIGMVFQSYALYPHLTARENILSYFLFRGERTVATETIAEEKLRKTSELLGVGMEHLLARKPPTLSGGERQRVALGRCITRDPALFLLDEPFSSLDHNLRRQYRANLKILLRQFRITTVYVTHDQQEAILFGDRIAIMNKGAIEQVGTAEDLYYDPDNRFVAEFLNLDTSWPPMNFIDGDLLGEKKTQGMLVGVRAEDILVSTKPQDDALPGHVVTAVSLAIQETTLLQVRVAGQELDVRARLRCEPAPETPVWLRFKHSYVFDRQSGQRVRMSSGA